MSQVRANDLASSLPHQAGAALVGPLLKAEQVADMLNVKVSTVYEWVRMGYMPSIRLGTGKKKPSVRFNRISIERWLETKSKESRRRPPETDK